MRPPQRSTMAIVERCPRPPARELGLADRVLGLAKGGAGDGIPGHRKAFAAASLPSL